MIIVGDFAPGSKKVVDRYSGGSVVLANLEGPILPTIKDHLPMPKAGPSLFSCELPDHGRPYMFSLANNHLMDFGSPGLDATLIALEERGCKACGAGKDICDARQPIMVEDGGVLVGIISCCETQFGGAGRDTAGVAEIGPWIYHAIRNLCERVDSVLVSVHAAVEDSPWPSPYFRQLCRSFVDAGVSVVHGHHSHVPQGFEAHGDGVIFYGMGNFAVDPERWHKYPNGLWSLAAEIDFGSKPVRWRPFSLENRQQRGTGSIVIEKSNDDERMTRLRHIEMCNRPFDRPELFDALWQEVALRAYHHYGATCMHFPSFSMNDRYAQIRKCLSMLKGALFNRCVPRPNQSDYLLWYHMIACDSHRQMLATSLGVLAGELKDMRTDESRQLADEMVPWSSG